MSVADPKAQAILKDLAEAQWRLGSLAYKLDSNQRGIYQQIHECGVLQFVIEAARKVGKSYLLCVIAIETALQHPGGRINYAAPTAKEAAEIVVPVINEIIQDAPPDLKPEYNKSTGHWTFPNGAYIVLFGCDDEAKADRGRGPQAILNIVDEAGFIPVLSYVLDSVLAPQTLRTKGRTILGSTPPKSPAHDFVSIAIAAEENGAYAHRDIYSNGMMTREQIDAYIAQRAAARGLSVEEFKETTDFKREYLAQRVVDEDSAVVPEFSKVKDQIVRACEQPPFFDAFVSVDLGFKKDLSAVVWGYWDFLQGVLVIQRVMLLKRATTQEIAETVAKVEKELWPGHNRITRVADDPTGRFGGDCFNINKLIFQSAEKHNRDFSISLLRMWVASKKIALHPDCKALINQLATATFNKSGNDIERTIDGHADALMALVYLCRTADGLRHRNPYPPDWDVKPGQIRIGGPVKGPTRFQRTVLGNTPAGRRLLQRRKRH